MDHELWNLKVKEYNIVAYTERFNELALMYPRMVKPERVKVDVYIRGLTDNIKGEVTSSKPANLNEAVRMAHKLMEQKSQARDEIILEGKKQKWENYQSRNSSGKNNHKDNSYLTLQNNQKQGNVRAMITAPTDGKSEIWVVMLERDWMEKWMNCIKMEYGKMEQPTLSKARRGAYIGPIGHPWAMMDFPWASGRTRLLI
ncbi:hypothetical protein Tco_0378444 [Tanacetum coccineum]